MSADTVRRLLERRIPGARLTCADSGARRTGVTLQVGDVRDAVQALCAEPGARFMTLTAVDRGTEIDLLYQAVLEEFQRLVRVVDGLPA